MKAVAPLCLVCLCLLGLTSCSNFDARRMAIGMGSNPGPALRAYDSRKQFEADRTRDEYQETVELRQTLAALYPGRADEFKEMPLAQLRGEMNAAKLKRDWKEK